MQTPIPVLCLMGPTATGKTLLSLELAQYFPMEVISVDSAMVYTGMDIGTGKPTQAEQAGVPHHLLSIRAPHDPYSAADFCKDAFGLIQAIHARGRIPALVGGTCLYFKALIDGLSPLPAPHPEIRAHLSARATTEGWAALHAELAACDPEAARRIRVTDPQRIQRALEVWLATGKPLTAHFAEAPVAYPCSIRWHTVALMAQERQALHQQIAARFKAMCAAGFLEEVQTLRADPRHHADLPAIRSVGYRQMWNHLDGLCDWDTMQHDAIVATRQLAKRQMTWLRGWPGLYALDWQTPNRLAQVRTHLHQAGFAE